VRQSIEACYAKLTSQQRRAADYLLANQHTAFAMSVSELAHTAQVSEATLVRFAREIGFKGYHELRAALMGEARQDLSPEDRFAYEAPSREPASTMARVAKSEVDNIQRTAEEVDPRELKRFVTRLGKASLVATMGLGVSAILARLAQYLLFQIGVRAELVSREAVTLAEQVELLPRQTALLVFSLPPYSRQTIEAAARARERKLTVLAITDDSGDSDGAPIGKYAHAVLRCHSRNVLFTNSLSSPLILLNAVVTDLALANKANALRHLKTMDRASHGEYL
jgi:DNA-binding MurR/RpiR family transcriptional regulator